MHSKFIREISSFKAYLTKPWIFPIVLLLICVAGFGLLIPWLGFYQDDWYQVWFGRTYGINIFVDYYATERPFMSFLYMLTMPFVGTSPLNWQIFGLFSRWLAVLSVWFVLSKMWPNKKRQIIWITVLFAIYPGFRQQYAAVIYSHYFLQFAIQMLSIWFMILAIQRPRRYLLYTALSIVIGIFGLLPSEYFFGLELMKPIIIWIIVNDKNALPAREKIKKTFTYWIPYLLITIGFLFWRLLLYKFPTYQPIFTQSSTANPWELFRDLAVTIAKSMFETGVIAWVLPLRIFTEFSTDKVATFLALGLAIISSTFIILYLFLQNTKQSDITNYQSKQKNVFPLTLIFTGLFCLLVSGLPFWFVGLPVNNQLTGGSRFTISFMLGASLLAGGLIDLLARRSLFKIFLVGIIAGLAIGHHFKDANIYRRVSTYQANFFQQLVWRAPMIKPGTLILTNPSQEIWLNGYSSLTAAMNWIYGSDDLNYLLLYAERSARGENELPSLDPGLTVEIKLRTAKFIGSTSKAIVIYFPYPNCLQVMEPAYDSRLPRQLSMSSEIHKAIDISNTDQIIPNPDNPAFIPDVLFRDKPQDTEWCFYFEKASLARQQGNWQKIIELGEAAKIEQRTINSAWEYLPFIEAYARGGQLENAAEITFKSNNILNMQGIKPDMLCKTWERISKELKNDNGTVNFLSNLSEKLNCTNY